MKKIEAVRIRPWDRDKYPGYFSKTELREKKLMPAPNVKPRAIVERPEKYGGNYYLYTIEKTVPLRKTVEQKKQDAKARRLRLEKKKNIEIRERKIQTLAKMFADDFPVPTTVYETVVIDFETTGFDRNKDEVLQVSIIDQDGNSLINQLCRPIVKKTWPEAESIHGITPGMVKGKPSFLDVAPKVAQILHSAKEVVAYNSPFEAGFLSANGIDSSKLLWGKDPMVVYAQLRNSGKYAKLSVAAAEYGYRFQAHDALEDVRATLFLHNQLRKELLNRQEVENCDRKDMAY